MRNVTALCLPGRHALEAHCLCIAEAVRYGSARHGRAPKSSEADTVSGLSKLECCQERLPFQIALFGNGSVESNRSGYLNLDLAVPQGIVTLRKAPSEIFKMPPFDFNRHTPVLG